MTDEIGILAFCELIANTVGYVDARPTDRLVADLSVGPLSMAAIVLTIEQLNPYFSLPDQIDVADLTIEDLHYFCCTMTEGHLAWP